MRSSTPTTLNDGEPPDAGVQVVDLTPFDDGTQGAGGGGHAMADDTPERELVDAGRCSGSL